MNPETVEHGKLISKEDYYKDVECISFSGLKVFSKCETLYRDLFVTKVYEEPDHDYFTYGKLVDAMVTESDEFIAKEFVRVERRVNPEDALKLENTISMLKVEISEKEAQNEASKEEKPSAIKEKTDKVHLAITKKREKEGKDADISKEMEKLGSLNDEFNNVPGNKTLEKGIESRKAEILEVQASLDLIKNFADKIQVTGALWDNAESTALALKTHPSYTQMEFNEVTSQQIFTTIIDGIPAKGKLDHLKLSPALTKFYAIYMANQMTLEELQHRIRTEVHASDLWAIITDIKTCKDLATLEPFNKHYRGQLGFYQTLVSAVLLVPIKNIRCRILVADKMNNNFKKCELFEYTQEALDELKPDVWAWARLWLGASTSRKWVSAKEKDGMGQKCFTCTECRFCPFSVRPGDPVVVAAPRFETNLAPLTEELSTADAVLDY